MARIFVLDDDSLIRRLITQTATEQGHEVASAPTIAEGLAQCAARPFDVVILDILLPDGNGLEVIPRLRDMPSRPEIVIITGHGDPEGAELAIRHGAWDYLTKPLSVENLLLTLNRVVSFRGQRDPGGCAIYHLTPAGIVGESRALRLCLEQMAQAASGNVNVMLLGETGTGKELFARAIHEHSARSAGPFVPLDCACLTQTLLEDRMFGHVKGSFTGADQNRDGVARLAHRGTLFLDEVGELPPALQSSFLRLLETKRFRPIGARDEVESDFRIVSATNRNLRELADMDLFRADLLYRLQGVTIHLPPLRERREDIPLICRHYLVQLCQQYGSCGKDLTDDLMDTLLAYDWPGNVRELVHALERAFTAAREEPQVFSWHLPVDIRMAVAKGRLRASAQPGAASPAQHGPGTGEGQAYQNFRDFREATDKSYLKGLIDHCPTMTEAARVSGLSRGYLYQLLKKHGLDSALK